MTLLNLVVIAVVQGITEFLPISSSGHLVLVPVFTDWPDQGLMIDIAVHVGTLGAVMLWCWREIWQMLVGLKKMTKGKPDPGQKLLANLIIGTIPVVAAGFAMHHYMPGGIRSFEVVAWATIGFGILLWLADHFGMTVRRIEHLRWGGALFIGVAQVLALIPGTSRSGITMTAARLMGYERPEAARFSMLLSIPTILGAGVLVGKDIYDAGDAELTSQVFLVAGLSFITALIAILLMMAWLKRARFTPFVIYRILLGLVLLWMVYGSGVLS